MSFENVCDPRSRNRILSLIFSFHPTLPDEGFKEHRYVSTSVAAMWALINATKMVLDSGEFDWVFPTGGDQVIWRFDIPPSKLLPESAQGGAKYDIVLVADRKTKAGGLHAPPIIQNTIGGREFVHNWYSYASKGNYLVEDQGVMNVLLLQRVVTELSTKEDLEELLVQQYFNATGCPINIPMAVYDYQRAIGVSQYVEESSKYSSCVEEGLKRFYGPRPWNSNSPGARFSTVLLYHPGSEDPDLGFDWNGLPAEKFSFMRHFSGVLYHSRSQMQQYVRETIQKYPEINVSIPSSEYERCVRKLWYPNSS